MRLVLVLLAALLPAAGFTQTTKKIQNTTYQTLPFSQNWTNTSLLTAADDWSGVPGIMGYRGDNLTSATGVDPQTILTAETTGVVDVNVDQTDPNTYTTGGATEFQITNPVVALAGSGTADAPYLVIYLNTTGKENILVSYLLRDIDASSDNADQKVALHYRVGGTGNFINIASAYVADASSGPSLTTETPVSITLPEACNDQSMVELRIMTTNAGGNDEWIGVDDILIDGDDIGGAKPVITLAANQSSLLEDGSDSIVVTITTSFPVADTQTATLSLTGSATTDDLTLSATDLTFEAGDDVKTVVVKGLEDSDIEGDETFTLALTSLSEGLKAGNPSSLNLKVTDNDAITIELMTRLSQLQENAGGFYLIAKASQAVDADQTIDLSYSGTATANTDYSSVSGLTLSTGMTIDSVLISIMDETDFETNETIIIGIESITGGALKGSNSSVTVTILNDDAQQVESIASARSKTLGTKVLVKGTVTGAYKGNVGTTIYFQDETGGIGLYDRKTDGYAPGDSIYISGVTSDRFGVIQIINVDSAYKFPVKGTYSPKVVTSATAKESFESQFVLMKNLKFQSTGTFAGETNYKANDRAGEMEIRITGLLNTLIDTAIPTDSVDMVGVLGQFNSFYQLMPRNLNDVVASGGVYNVSLVLSSTSAAEADLTEITITAKTLSPVNSTATIDVVISGTGITTEDYSLSGTTITIPAGGTEGSVTLSVLNDQANEGTEVLNVSLTNPSSNLVIASGNGTVVITDDDGDVKDYISIAEARVLPLGTTVTVTGRIVVANQFGGPAYFQDKTGGMGVFESTLHTAVAIGDSVKITGPTTEFAQKGASSTTSTDGELGTGLFQISGTGTTFEVFKDNPVEPEPLIITLADIGEIHEGKLVKILNVTINHTGNFQANTNYTITDPSLSMNLGMRIDNNTNLVGAAAPTGAINMIGVVSQAFGNYQVMPRMVEDIGAKALVIPGESVSRDLTFEAVTWNMKWFGEPAMSGFVDSTQIKNAARLIRTMNADLYALQEISNTAAWNTLMDSLRVVGYRGFVAPISQQQKTAYIYKDATIDSVQAKFSFNTGDWANGRFPYEFTFDATVNGKTKRITAINIHAKATTSTPPEDDVNRREMDAIQLKNYIDNSRPFDAVMILGDYNDDVIKSTVGTLNSPYNNFVSDPTSYLVVTKWLSDRKQTSYKSLNMLDHITITNELFTSHWDSTQRVENPFYIGSYLSTTSDHFPVWTRFDFTREVGVEDNQTEVPVGLSLAGNYPNPFNPSTAIRYYLPVAGKVKLEVYNLLGKRLDVVEVLSNTGWQTLNWSAGQFPTGTYFYRLSAGNQTVTGKMMLLK